MRNTKYENMERFSVACGFTSLLCTTGQVIQYLNSVRDAPKEQAELAQERCLLHGPLISLERRFEGHELTAIEDRCRLVSMAMHLGDWTRSLRSFR